VPSCICLTVFKTIDMSSLALHKPFHFAPKREPWYGDFFKPQKARPHVIAFGVLSPILFAVVLLVSLQVVVIGMSEFQPTTTLSPVTFVPATPAGDDSPLVASVDAATHFFHVPGAYVDTATIVPSIEAPQFVVSKEDVANMAPYVMQSLRETLSADWDKTFGMGGMVFVASVYEFGNDGAAAMQQEMNIPEAWSEYINGLSAVLEPYLTSH